MKWQDMRQSDRVEDRRGVSPRMGGGLRLRPGGLGGLGLGGLLILLVLGWVFGGDPLSLLSPEGGLDPGSGFDAPAGPPAPAASDEGGRFVSAILGDTEDTWSPIFAQAGARYAPPALVLFSDEVESACGFGTAAVGPFYCPADRKVYIDLAFFRDLDQRFGAPGDFAQAYVIAHEVGHHVQTMFGVLGGGRGLSKAEANAQSVRQELQADCLAGVWGHSAATRRLLDPGDVEEGLTAAAAIGDDRLQRASTGRVVPESFTHGSSAERVAAVRLGLTQGTLDACGIRPR
jgi:hypothetical protein